MPSAPLPPDEADRLLALRRSGLLQSGSDMRLDALVHRAALLFNVPMSAISLIDESQHLSKASIGVGVPYTSRDLSFCAHAIMGEAPMVVLDAWQDPRFADNPFVLGKPGIRFYAGAPVYGPGHQPFGAICAMDTRSYEAVTPEQLAVLRELAAEVTAIFANPPDIALKPERRW